jgi:Effector-associated domain 7
MVIIPAMEDDLLPGQFDDSRSRRMLYVAMSRTRRILILTHAFSRMGFGSHLGTGQGKTSRPRSRYLTEMGIQSLLGDKFVRSLPSQLAQNERIIYPQAQPITLQVLPRLDSSAVNTSELRKLINTSFSDEELMIFCYDNYRVVYDQFGVGMSKTVHIQRLIESCERRGLIGNLMEQVRQFSSPHVQIGS